MNGREQFRKLIEQLTREAERDPGRYRRRVLWLVARGYAYLFGVLLLLVLLLVASAAAAVFMRSANYFVIKAFVAILLLTAVVLRALWVQLPPPTGWELDPGEAPALEGMIEEVRERLGAPPLSGVLFDRQYNAAIVQHPSLGVFGGYQCYLILGLPLMEALSPDQFRAVIAHEFGHLSGQHGRFGVWIYRIRASWIRLMTELSREKRRDLFADFFRRYMPEFDATTFVLARQQEYEADRMSAQVAGARTAAAALVRVALYARVYAGYWNQVDGLVALLPQAPRDVATAEAAALRAGVDPACAEEWLDAELRRPTDLDDTHPSLRDRLADMGVDARESGWRDAVPVTAAAALLGPALPGLQERASGEWVERFAGPWQEQHRHRQELRAQYASYRDRVPTGSLTASEWVHYIQLAARVAGLEVAITLARERLEAEPGRHRIRLQLGSMLLAGDEEEGLNQIREVVEREPAMAVEECAQAGRWLFERGRTREAEEWEKLGERCEAARAPGYEERRTLKPDDEFLPHSLNAPMVARLREKLSGIRGVKGAWLVQKKVRVLPEIPAWVLALAPSSGWLGIGRGNRARNLLQQFGDDLPLPDGTLIAVLGPDLACLVTTLDAVDDSRVL